ncbi:MAG: hypothetical protein RMJ67_06395 [Elusimicrobiota bacterium]|nr:hypothetical protein [Endomicrobiia bacterium]MDW8166123.1 hypothetical protein [Elusimicrobiota bacterium]
MSELILLNSQTKKTKKKRIGDLGKKRRLVVYGEPGNVIISPLSSLAPASRGRVLNPVVKSGDINVIVGLGVGFISSRVIPRFFDRFLPDALKVGLGRIAIQTASGVGVGILVSKVLKKQNLGRMIIYGSLLNAVINLLDNYIMKGTLSAEGLSTLEQLPENQYEGQVNQLPEENIVEQLPEENVIEQLPEEEIVSEITEEENIIS